jgi:hypothetical protein
LRFDHVGGSDNLELTVRPAALAAPTLTRRMTKMRAGYRRKQLALAIVEAGRPAMRTALSAARLSPASRSLPQAPAAALLAAMTLAER